jgi:hypothetical protein
MRTEHIANSSWKWYRLRQFVRSYAWKFWVIPWKFFFSIRNIFWNSNQVQLGEIKKQRVCWQKCCIDTLICFLPGSSVSFLPYFLSLLLPFHLYFPLYFCCSVYLFLAGFSYVYTRWICAIFNFVRDSRILRVGTPAGKMYLRNVMWTHNFEPELSHVHTLEYPILSHANYLEVGSKRKALIMIMERGGKSIV